MAHAAAGRYEEAVRAAQQSIQLNSGFPPVYLTLAASYVGLGRLQEARSTVRELLRLHPGFSLTGVKAIMTGWDSEFAERSIDALRMAGLPEQAVTQREPVLVTALTTVFTANDKIANAEQKFVKDVEKKCALLQDPASAFAGACAHPDLGVVGDCVIKAAGCQACLEINAFDDLDDGLESSA